MQSLHNMARLALQRSQPERANWPIMTALSLFPDDPQRPRLLYLLGEAFFQQGKLKESAFVFDKIKSEYPEYGEAHSAQVRLTTLELYSKKESLGFSLGPDPQTWIDPAHPLFHVHPDDPYLQEAVLSLGKLLSKKGEQDLAFQLLLNARRGFEETTISPEILKSLVNVARTTIHKAVQTDRHGRAIEMFDGLTQWVPEVWEDLLMLVDLAESYEAIGFYEMASSFYKKAYLLDRHSSSGWDAMLGLVRMEVGLGHYERALALLDQVPPDRKWKQTARGLVEWSGSEHCTQSAETIHRCLKEIPTGMLSLESVVLLGQYYVDRGQYKHAATFLENALSGKSMTGEESIKWAEGYCLLGESLRHLGKTQEAMTHYEKVLEREPWGFLEKWAAYRDSQVGIEAGARDRVRPYLERLLQEPEGALWRGLAEYLDQRMRPAEENTEEGVSWS
jgi:tetratricopeptide (TPR) repeat protein